MLHCWQPVISLLEYRQEYTDLCKALYLPVVSPACWSLLLYLWLLLYLLVLITCMLVLTNQQFIAISMSWGISMAAWGLLPGDNGSFAAERLSVA